MIAKFDGWCRSCYPRHAYAEGTEIEKEGRGWSPVACIEKAKATWARERAIIDRAKLIGLWLGVWDCPDGMQKTFSRAEFIHKAEALSILQGDDKLFLVRLWAGCLHRDLSD